MPQKVTISGGGFQDPQGNPLALGEIVVALQQDVQVGNVQLSAGIKNKLHPQPFTLNPTSSISLTLPVTSISHMKFPGPSKP